MNTRKETDGFVVTFEDGTVKQTFLSPKGLIQLLSMKVPVQRTEARVATNGEVADE